MRYVIVGGGLASVRAAEQLRREDSAGEIIVVSDESVMPYDHPPLSKEILRGEWPAEDAYLHPRDYYQGQDIDLRLGTATQHIDTAAKKLVLADSAAMPYDKLLIATGTRPRPLGLPGGELPGVHYLRTLNDSMAIRQEAQRGRRAVVIGAGFIGMEVAASLAQKGVQVTVLESTPYIWSRFLDEDLALYFQHYYEGHGIVFETGVSPEEIVGQEQAAAVIAGSQGYSCDFVCVGVGVMPNMEIAAASGLEVDDGIIVNEYLETSHPDIYGAGDVVNFYDPIFEKRRRIEHWGHAEYTGLLAAQNMVGHRTAYGLLSYIWSDIFDLHIEFTGEERDHDALLVRGDPKDNSFIVLYLKEQRLRAYLAVNAAEREFIPLQRMIRRKIDLSDKHDLLADTTVELRDLLR